jgi:hypothetical protein
MEDWKELLIRSYARFHEMAEQERSAFPGLVSFDIVELASKSRGTFAWKWSVPAEIQETINIVNDWGMRLHQWHLWMRVIEETTEKDQWEVSNHFLDHIIFFCMFQPSALADRLLEVAENALHQANQGMTPNEPDTLDQDRKKKGHFLSRAEVKKQLNRLGNRWERYPTFIEAWESLNTENYRTLTANYRNRAAHSLAPRLEVGQISRAKRSIVPWEELVPHPDGGVMPTPHPTKKAVQYSMGVIEPISFKEAHAANLAEYNLALATMDAFATLMKEICTKNTVDQQDKGA